jgi:adenylate kinase family enzyme
VPFGAAFVISGRAFGGGMMRRIMIVGQPGAGKSTLARALAAKTGLPVVHIDHIHWQAGWVERPRDEKTRLCNIAEAGERWIFEGGHSATWPSRLARADMLIWLDVPVWRRLGRVARRTVALHGRSRPDLPAGCAEGFHRETLPFWRFIWRTRHTGRSGIQRLWDSAPADKHRVYLCSNFQIRQFLQSDLPK